MYMLPQHRRAPSSYVVVLPFSVSAVISIGSNLGQDQIMNPSGVLQLSANVAIPANLTCLAQWSIDDVTS